MKENNNQVQIKAAECLLECVSQELSKVKSDLIYELFGLHTVEDFNKFSGNTTVIINGKICYKKDVIMKHFSGFFLGCFLDCNNNESLNLVGIIKSLSRISKNFKIIYYNKKIDKENRRIYNLYISSRGEKNIYKRIENEKNTLLLLLENKSEDEINFFGGIESYTQTAVSSAFLHQLADEYKKEMKPTCELIKKRNELLFSQKRNGVIK